MDYDQLTLQAGFGPPPILPPDTIFVNVSRLNALVPCERRFHIDYNLNVRYTDNPNPFPKAWLGVWLHKFVERLHLDGWESTNPERLVTEATKDLDAYDPHYEEFDAVKLLRLCVEYRKRWLDAETYDQVHAVEQEGWLYWNGVCFLFRLDFLVEKDGILYDRDLKTSSLAATDIFDSQRRAVQRAVTGEALSRVCGPLFALPYGGAEIDYLSTDIPDPLKQVRKNKDGSDHAGDLKTNISRAEKLVEWREFGFQRATFREFQDEQYRAEILFENGVWHKARVIQALRDRTLEPYGVFGSKPYLCRGCPHIDSCKLGKLPDPQDYYLREPDYVDLAIERNAQ